MRLQLTAPVLLLAIACGGGGCTRYAFDVVQPPDVAQRVEAKRWATVPYDPLRYELTATDGRLVMRIVNPTDQPVTLLGHASFVVSPRGQSHPLPGQTIAPGSYVQLVLPPPRPTVYDPGPRFSVGFGTGVGFGSRRRGYYGSSLGLDDGPRHYTVYDPSDARFWSWEGETNVRLSLAYQRGQDQFMHDFVFARRRV
ncbi:MAG TPA: hypothetical protein VK324_09870 [Tepidisphaeraceae bacterium]|nr:hypothetical protein [Tepidisphaeraceae bacterium]